MKKLIGIIVSFLALSLTSEAYSYGDWTGIERPPYYESPTPLNPEYHNYDNDDQGTPYSGLKYNEDRYNPPTYQDPTDVIMQTYNYHGEQERTSTPEQDMHRETGRYGKESSEHRELERQRYSQEAGVRAEQVEEKEGVEPHLEPQETRDDQSMYY
jgi:hypothetical protein